MSDIITNVSIGSDCEWFLKDKKTGEIVSAEGIIKGSKMEPFYFEKDNPYYATQLDNVLAEGNIPPAKSEEDFKYYLNYLRSFINHTVADQGLTTAAIPAARLDEKWLQSDNAKLFGCDPSLNCWTLEEDSPQPTGDTLRSAGFHIHVGYDNPAPDTNRVLACAMDFYLGLTSVMFEPKSDRREVGYGKAGNFRHQPHGVEYRTLSSYLSSFPEWAYAQTMKAIDAVNDGSVGNIVRFANSIQEAINYNNHNLARVILMDVLG